MSAIHQQDQHILIARFLRKHVKLLALHLQQQHPQQFSDAVSSHCSMSIADPIVETESLPVNLLTSPPHHYEEVDGSPRGAYLQILPDPLELRRPQESKRQRREERERGERTGKRMQQTPQRSQHTRSFKRATWKVGETYQGIAQPEPPPLPITGQHLPSLAITCHHVPELAITCHHLPSLAITNHH